MEWRKVRCTYQSEWQDKEKVKAKVDRAVTVRRERRAVAKEVKL